MTAPGPSDDEFIREVERQAERRRRGRAGGVWQGLAQVGTIGWMVALPAIGGAYFGRWLDGRQATGIFWTLFLLTVGITIGCVAAWRAMSRELRMNWAAAAVTGFGLGLAYFGGLWFSVCGLRFGFSSPARFAVAGAGRLGLAGITFYCLLQTGGIGVELAALAGLLTARWYVFRAIGSATDDR